MELKSLQGMPPWEWPDDADQLLLEVLRDKRAASAERLLAAELGGDFTVINDELAAALLAIVESGEESDELRGKAAICLGPVLEEGEIEGFDEPDEAPISERTFQRVVAGLRKVYFDAGAPKRVRRRALEASVRAPQDWHREAIRDAWSGRDEDWKVTGVFCMRFVPGFDAEILEALDSRVPEIACEAVSAAGSWELAGAWRHVLRVLESPAPDRALLLAAIEAAACIDPEEAPALLERYARAEDEEIAEAAREAIGMAEELAEQGDEEGEDRTH